MAESDGLKNVYGIPSVVQIRQGYVSAKNRQQKREERKKHQQEAESGSAAESSSEERKGVDIKV